MVKLNSCPEEGDGEEEGRRSCYLWAAARQRGLERVKSKSPRHQRKRRQKRRKRKPTVRKVVKVKPQGLSVELW